MPAATTHGFPYPVGGDALADTDLRIKELSDFLEAKWAAPISPPYCSLAASAATSLATSAWTKIALATTVHNDAAAFSVSGSVITVLASGLYSVSAQAYGPAVNSSSIGATVSKNGLPGVGVGVGVAQQFMVTSSFFSSMALIAERLYFPLVANDTIQLSIYHNNGGAQNSVHNASQIAALTLVRVGT